MTVDGDTMDVIIAHASLAEYENCRVTRVSATVFSRATPFESSNGGAAVAFSAGGLVIFSPRGVRELALNDQGALVLPEISAAPGAPSSGLELFVRNKAGRRLFGIIGPSGLDSSLQFALWSNRIGLIIPSGNGTTVTAIGILATATGTATARNIATTNLFTSTRRLGYVSAATAGASAGPRNNALQYWRGNAANLGGFFFVCRFGISDAAAVADARMFVGLYGTAAVIGNVNPSTLLNIVGVACDNAQTTMRIMHNDGSGVATTIDLGANFPVNTLSTDLYELMLFCAPNGSDIKYRVERINTGHVAEGTLTTDLPTNTQLLSPQVWRNNGATALAVGIDLISQYIETDT